MIDLGTRTDVRNVAASRILTGAGSVTAAVLAVVALAQRDFEAIVLAALFGAGLALVHIGNHRLGASLLVLLSLDALVWMAPATYRNLINRAGAATVVIPALIAGASLTVLVAGAMTIVARSPRMLWLLPVACLAVALVLAMASLVRARPAPVSQPNDLRVQIRSTAFSTRRLEANAGEVGIYVHNHDLFWHTFTVTGTGVNLTLPDGSARRITVNLVPGRYRYYCRIPGHAQAGMSGTLTVT